MSFGYDWDSLKEKVEPDESKIAFNDVKHLFKKVAFDVYKEKSGDSKLWELREEDGVQYLVALYENDDTLTVESNKEANEWSATPDSEGKNVTLSYRDFPLKRIAIADLGVKPDKADEFASFLVSKVQDKTFLSNLINSMPKQKKIAVLELLDNEDKDHQ